ncbi:hypothetical protein P3X46_026028 [Hevea brasiliensis]|uniref:Bidirectional sugar transporter SWEET n=1 Tax=Hevea brasiliensis TaxID=3981 RepID=A0ABQ9KVB7_HEVBR|nr:hypothetical protein P3X46_026028 [Hevea brasiliensis]
MMVDREVARTIIGIIGNILSVCLFGSPIPTFVEILKSKSVGEFKPDSYLATILNCSLWSFYGLPVVHKDTLLMSINSIGLAMEAIYVTIFFIHAQRNGRVKVIKWIFIELVFLAILVACILKFSDTHEQRSKIVGIICLVFNVLMYASPLTMMIGNSVGILSGATQLVLHACYNNVQTTLKDEDVKPAAELQVQLSTTDEKA